MKEWIITGLAENSIGETKRFLTRIENFINPQQTSDFDQKAVNGFIKARIDAVKSKHTVNKDIARLRALLNWLKKQGYHDGKVDISLMKAPKTIKKALTTEQIRALLKACPTECWRMRILLSLCTGLRAGDIDRLKTADVSLERSTIDTESRKTGKAYSGRPIPDSLCPALRSYVENERSTGDNPKLLPDVGIRKTWSKIREKAGLPKVTRQDFRITFSTLIQKIGGIGSAQNLLEHSDSRTTADFYTDTELILRFKVNRLPVLEWLMAQV